MNSWGRMESVSTKPPQIGLPDSCEPVVFHSKIESCYLPFLRPKCFSRHPISLVRVCENQMPWNGNPGQRVVPLTIPVDLQ
jgi:hypothetical protein